MTHGYSGVKTYRTRGTFPRISRHPSCVIIPLHDFTARYERDDRSRDEVRTMSVNEEPRYLLTLLFFSKIRCEIRTSSIVHA